MTPFGDELSAILMEQAELEKRAGWLRNAWGWAKKNPGTAALTALSFVPGIGLASAAARGAIWGLRGLSAAGKGARMAGLGRGALQGVRAPGLISRGTQAATRGRMGGAAPTWRTHTGNAAWSGLSAPTWSQSGRAVRTQGFQQAARRNPQAMVRTPSPPRPQRAQFDRTTPQSRLPRWETRYRKVR
jgi:hypothetical protein